MRKPVARPASTAAGENTDPRTPRAFAPPVKAAPVDILTDLPNEPALPETVAPPRRHVALRVALATGGLLISLALGLAAEALIRDLFARYEWLGWLGVGAATLLVLALVVLALRELASIFRLRKLDRLRARAAEALESDNQKEGRAIAASLQTLYAGRSDLARPRRTLDENLQAVFDGAEVIKTSERSLMQPLDNRARALIAGSARRVALVTAVSPRALVDIAFVVWESFRLARAIATLYGARPGLFGSWRLAGAILSHLAITGGVALGDSVVQQLLGHGLAAKLSARLGEGLVNGLMTVRVGIAAMRVTRPLPFAALKQPVVMDFMADLAKIGTGDKTKA